MDKYLEKFLKDRGLSERKIIDSFSEEIPEEDRDSDYYENLNELAKKRQINELEIEL